MSNPAYFPIPLAVTDSAAIKRGGDLIVELRGSEDVARRDFASTRYWSGTVRFRLKSPK
jgi:hypothetical protein